LLLRPACVMPPLPATNSLTLEAPGMTLNTARSSASFLFAVTASSVPS
jgi:hypothetical protein